MNLYVKALATIENLPVGTKFIVSDLLTQLEWGLISNPIGFGRNFKSIMNNNSNLFNVKILPPNGGTQQYEKI